MEYHLNDLAKPQNTAGVIAATIVDAILHGKLASGQPLKQNELASKLGVSKIPVREALIQLEAQGLVTFYPNRGAVVSELSASEISEIYLMRVALETTALKYAIPNMIQSDFDKAEHVLNQIDDETDAVRWSMLNWEFHRRLYQSAELPRLISTVESLQINVARYLSRYRTSLNSMNAQREHRQILAACQNKMIEVACNLLEQHLNNAANLLAEFIH